MKALFSCVLALSVLTLCLDGCTPAANGPSTDTSTTVSSVTTTVTTTATSTTTTTVNLEAARPAVDSADIGQLVPADFVFHIAGLSVRPGDDAAPLLAALGEAEETREFVAGGYWTDKSITHTYPGLSVITEQYEDKHEISSIDLLGTACLLYKDVTVGCTREDLYRQYGEPAHDEDHAVFYLMTLDGHEYTLYFGFSGLDENEKYRYFDTVQRISLSTNAYSWSTLEN